MSHESDEADVAPEVWALLESSLQVYQDEHEASSRRLTELIKTSFMTPWGRSAHKHSRS